MEFQFPQIDSLISLLTRPINWAGRKLYNVGAIYSKLFSTNQNVAAQRIEIKQDGLYAYNDLGVLIAKISIAAGSEAIYTDIVQAITQAYIRIISKTSKAVLFVSDNVNGSFQLIGDAASGNLTITVDNTVGLQAAINGTLLNFVGGFLQLQNASILLDDGARVVHGNTYIRFFDNGAGTQFLGYYVNNALKAQMNVNDLDLSGLDLKFKTAKVAITTEVLSHYILAKDSGGNVIKLAIVS